MKRGNKPYSVTFESLVMQLVKHLQSSSCLCGEVCINKRWFRRMVGLWRDMLQVDLLRYVFQLCYLTAVNRFGSTGGVSPISPANSRSALSVSGEIKVALFQCICFAGF